MKAVGLRELKNRLGVYMRHVRSGESIAVTDRGRLIAQLTPAGLPGDDASILADFARKGELTLARPIPKRQRASRYKVFAPALRGVKAAELLDAERTER
jgi:prevent-host-death family protein